MRIFISENVQEHYYVHYLINITQSMGMMGNQFMICILYKYPNYRRDVIMNNKGYGADTNISRVKSNKVFQSFCLSYFQSCLR